MNTLSTQGVELWAEAGNLRCKAPAGVLTAALRGELSARKAEILHRLATREIPLSSFQRQIWFLAHLYPGAPVSSAAHTLRIREAVNVDALARSLTELTRRHEILRTAFVTRNGTPMQVVLPPQPFDLPVADLRSYPKPEREARACQWAADDLHRPLDLTQGRILRARLACVDDDDFWLFVVGNDMITDAVCSHQLLPNELAALYRAFSARQPSPLPEPMRQYRDFVAWEARELTEVALAPQLAYWKRALQGIAPLRLPTDYPRPQVTRLQAANHPLSLGKTLAAGLVRLGNKEGATLFMVLAAAIKTLLYRYAGQEDIALGTLVSDRHRPGFAEVLGPAEKTMVLRTDLSGNPTVRELIERVRSTCFDAFAHNAVPFERIVAEVGPERVPGQNPLYQVMFILAAPASSSPGWEQRLTDVKNGVTQFDLQFWLCEQEDVITGTLTYNSDLFAAATIARMAQSFELLLEQMIVDVSARIAQMPLMTQAHRQALLLRGNDTVQTRDGDPCMHQLFEAQAARTPDAVAVRFDGHGLTYRALEQRANQVAAHLRELGVSTGERVGVSIERSPEMVVGVLGVLKAGGAYVPVDPAYPAERRAFMLRDAGARVLLTQQHLRRQYADHDGVVLCLDSDGFAMAQHAPLAVAEAMDAGALAYVIYTSGSTGKPKGVMITHRAAVNTLRDINGRFIVGEADRILALSSLSFDLSVYDLFGALAAGATIVMPRPSAYPDPADWLALMGQEKVTLWNSTPPMMEVLTRHVERMPVGAGKQLETLRVVMLSGDWIPVALPDRIRALSAHARVWSFGGATEASIWSICYPIGDVAPEQASIPYGKPMTNQQIYILDALGEPVPAGVVGELYIGGDGVAVGYLNRPELTAERFVPDVFRGVGTLYRTGDLGRYMPDGNIEFLGRQDSQVKIRGYRVELGEIEAALCQFPGVREAAVVVGDDGGGRQLVAYLVQKRQGGGATDAPDKDVGLLRRFLKQRLPDYMVPRHFVCLSALPLTPNGKLDRRALPAPDTTGVAADESAMGLSDGVEQQLAVLWRRVLDVSTVGPDDNFFDLGGHSLLVLRLAEEIQQELGHNPPLGVLFQCPTVRQLAAVLRDGSARVEVAVQ
nr:amino acid adenylation domain-containing protein [Burkholderia sp. Ac-20345]